MQTQAQNTVLLITYWVRHCTLNLTVLVTAHWKGRVNYSDVGCGFEVVEGLY